MISDIFFPFLSFIIENFYFSFRKPTTTTTTTTRSKILHQTPKQMLEHNIPILINQYIAASSGNDEEAVSNYIFELSNLISNDELSLLQFIQHLGPSLTSDKDSIRSKSIECLSKTIISLSDSKLTKQDINVLIEFLLNKLIDNDQICLQYSLMGINSLICKKNFLGDTNIEKILQQLYKNYDPKKNLAKVRYETFQILLNLLNQFNQYLNSSSIQLSNLYIKTFIHIASGEKDPRNLLISFELNNKINANFQFDNKNNELHQQFITDLFDICFCYFPISFKPPSNDPYKITSEQLKLALRETIASQSKFAPEAFPSLIEKLTSTNPTIRNDTLKTIELCIKNYSKNDATVIEEYWMTIWNALKFEILHNDISSNFNPTNNTIVASDYDEIDDNDEFKPLVLTLVILNRLILTLLQPEIMLHTVVEELKPNLEVMKEKSIKSSLILSSLGSTSVDNLNYIVDFLFQYQIWGKFLNIDKKEENEEQQEFDTNEDVSLNIAKQRDLIDSIGFVLTAYQVLKPTAHCHLLDYKDYILIFLGQLLTITSNLEKTLKCKIIQQLIKLIKLPGYLNTNELELILGNYFKQFFLDTTKTSGKKDVILQEIINGLIEVSQDSQITSLTIEFIINPILNQLLTTEDNDGGDVNIETFQFQLEIVGDLCINYQILEVISIRLLNKLPIINNQSNNNLQLYKIIINLFIELIKKIESIQQFLTNSWYKNFIPKFMENLLIVLPLENILHNNDDNYELFEIVGDLLGLIIKFIDVSKHQEILDQLNQTFIINNNDDDDDDEETNHQGPFKYPLNLLIEPNNYINVYNKILSSIDKTCVFKQDVDQQVIESIINLIYKIGNDDEYLRLQYLQTLCLLINKFTNNADFIESKLKFLEKVEEQDFPITKKDFISFEIFIWILKGLIVKLDKLGINYLNQLLELFVITENYKLKQLIGKSLQILFIDLKIFTNERITTTDNTNSTNGGIKSSSQLISKVKNLQVKSLYKQHIFVIILPYLINDSNENFTNDADFNLKFNSLSLIIENLSINGNNNILINQLSEILPITLYSLIKIPIDANSNSNLLASLIILNIILKEEEKEKEKDTIATINTNSSLLTKKNITELIPILIELITSATTTKGKSKSNIDIKVLSLKNLKLIIEKFDDIINKQKLLNDLLPALDDKKRVVRKLTIDLRQSLYDSK